MTHSKVYINLSRRRGRTGTFLEFGGEIVESEEKADKRENPSTFPSEQAITVGKYAGTMLKKYRRKRQYHKGKEVCKREKGKEQGEKGAIDFDKETFSIGER